MTLRPVSARWFELLTSGDGLASAVETLARTGRVELETHSDARTHLTMPDLHGRMEEYHRLSREYQAYWPNDIQPAALPGNPAQRLERALERLYRWQEDADPLSRRSEVLHNEQTELSLLKELFGALASDTLDFGLLANAGPALQARVFVLPSDAKVRALPSTIIFRRIPAPRQSFMIVMGASPDVRDVEQEMTVLKGRPVMLPTWLEGDAQAAAMGVEERLAALSDELQRLYQRIETVSTRHQLREALSDIAHLEWFLTNVTDLPVTENFAWVTGWTSDPSGEQLRNALAQRQVPGVVHFPPPPPGTSPPMVMQNPWWARPYELFARLLGTPARNEADPSPLLAVIVPLLFGYMFGDVGHGLVLLVASLVLRRRWPIARLLIPCGVTAMVFGVVFGEVFGRGDVIAPLWVHPIDDPLPVLGLPLLVGMGILLLGLVLNGVEAHWRGELGRWWRIDAAVLVLYVALIASPFTRWALGAVAVGLLWYLAGSVWQAPARPWSALGGALASLVESLMQLIINTVSFVRVGAFALAHAGLSMAFFALADATGSQLTAGLIILLGNIIVIMLEGLVVSIQTTRLILFEFFIRFLRGEGRIFRPLAAPTTEQVETRRTT